MDKDYHTKKTATIGGTFDALHAGHQEYIRLAFEYADRVFIYVNSDEYARPQKCYEVQPLALRISQLRAYLRNLGISDSTYEIRRLNALKELEQDFQNEEIHLAVVVPEYYPLVQNLNQLRIQNNQKPVLILVKERTRDSQNGDISSSAIHLACGHQFAPTSNGKALTSASEIALQQE